MYICKEVENLKIKINGRHVVHPFGTRARNEQINSDTLRNAFAFAG